jgi:hypothetical protein
VLVHLAIVSDQLLPTVIAGLMARPNRVVLVATQAMAAKARRLQALLRAEGIETEIRGNAPDAGVAVVRAYAAKLAAGLAADLPEAELVFNATGGTKLMTLGFVEVFRERASRIIYTDTANARIEVVQDRRGGASPSQPMRDVLDVPRYLAVQGFRACGAALQDESRLARMAAREPEARFLAANAVPLAGLIGTLNYLINDKALDVDGRSLKQPQQSLGGQPRGPWPKALRRLDRAGLLQWSGGTEIRIPDLESARFLGGGWLEEYAFAVVRDEGLYDVRINVEGVWEGAEAARNEFDVLACHRNRLLFIECKTLKIEGRQNDNELAYKVESLGKDTRGLFGDIWLLTARQPTAVLKARARQAGIRLVGPDGLPRLREPVRAWKQGSAVPERG